MKVKKLSEYIKESLMFKQKDLYDMFHEWIDIDPENNKIKISFSLCGKNGSTGNQYTKDIEDKTYFSYFILFACEVTNGYIEYEKAPQTLMINLINSKLDILDDYNLVINENRNLRLISKKQIYDKDQIAILMDIRYEVDPSGDYAFYIEDGIKFYHPEDHYKLILNNDYIKGELFRGKKYEFNIEKDKDYVWVTFK